MSYDRVVNYQKLISSGKKISFGDALGPAMEIVDQDEADAYFSCLVQDLMRHGKGRQEADTIARANLGYYAGYYSDETRKRVERLFCCAHPVFGAIADKGPPSTSDALFAGVKMAVGLTPGPEDATI